MRTRITNLGIDQYQTTPYFIVFSDLIILIAIIINLINKNFDLIFPLSVMLFLSSIAFVINIYILKFLKVAYLDDDYLYIVQTKSEIKVPLNKILTVEYTWYPALGGVERWILIKFCKENSKIEKVLIFPTQLDNNNNFKFNRYILWMIKERICKFNEKTMANKQ